MNAGRCTGADANAARLVTGMTGHRVQRGVCRGANTLGMKRKLDARCGRLRLATDALDQPHSQPFLQFPQLQADRWLRQSLFSSRGRKAAQLDNVQKGLQLVEIQSSHTKKS